MLKSGDHVVCAASVFGATVQLFSGLLARFGIDVTFVDAAAPSAWRAAVSNRTRLLFCETPSNPLMEITDLAALGALGRGIGALTLVDNCFCTPVLQRPLEFGVDAVIHSATKYLDGQGAVLGGAAAGSRAASCASRSCRCSARPVRVCRRSTPGCCSRDWRRSVRMRAQCGTRTLHAGSRAASGRQTHLLSRSRFAPAGRTVRPPADDGRCRDRTGSR